jgi:predicted DNA-binding protein
MQRKHIHIPDGLNVRIKAAAEKLEMSMAEFIRRAIEAALEKHGA